jgi:hypothetical protein
MNETTDEITRVMIQIKDAIRWAEVQENDRLAGLLRHTLLAFEVARREIEGKEKSPRP